MYPVLIKGQRILLREFRTEDLEDCLAVVGDPDVTVFLALDNRDRDQHADLLAKTITRAQGDARLDYNLAIAEAETGQLIGFVRITADSHQRAELGYALRKDHWGKGLVTEACKLMVTFAFAQLGIHRIQAACGPDNIGSQRVLQKLGFSYEGRLRGHVLINGAWRDSLLYSLLKDDPAWFPRQ